VVLYSFMTAAPTASACAWPRVRCVSTEYPC